MASIRRMPRGTWQAVVRRKGYRPQFHTFDTQHDAKQWARKIESEIDHAVFVARGPRERTRWANWLTATLLKSCPARSQRRALRAACVICAPHSRAIRWRRSNQTHRRLP